MLILFRLLILAVAALGLTALGLIAATGAAKDPTAHPAIGAPFDLPIRASPADGTPWQI